MIIYTQKISRDKVLTIEQHETQKDKFECRIKQGSIGTCSIVENSLDDLLTKYFKQRLLYCGNVWDDKIEKIIEQLKKLFDERTMLNETELPHKNELTEFRQLLLTETSAITTNYKTELDKLTKKRDDELSIANSKYGKQINELSKLVKIEEDTKLQNINNIDSLINKQLSISEKHENYIDPKILLLQQQENERKHTRKINILRKIKSLQEELSSLE